jgi:hypothetical protein
LIGEPSGLALNEPVHDMSRMSLAEWYRLRYPIPLHALLFAHAHTMGNGSKLFVRCTQMLLVIERCVDSANLVASLKHEQHGLVRLF